MALKQSNSNHANAVEENKKATKPEPKTRRPRTEKAKPAQEKAGRAKVQEKPARAKAADHPARSSRATHTSRTEKAPVRRTPVRIIPLGGLNEIGKNITCFECGQDMFIVDCGLAFPDTDMLGVDIVIPDYSYIEKNADRIRGLFITHGHEDHIGGIPYLLKKVNIPIYGSRLTLGLIEGKLREHGLLSSANLNVVVPRQTIKVGCMAVEMLRVNHSIPDAMGLAIHTPAGVIIHTGDFKVDYTPIEGEVIDLARFAELGNKGVLCLMSDSTNAERPGYTPSERTVGESFERLFKAAGSRRIIIATFSSNIHRVQQIVDNAVNHGRKVAISGRSMINVVSKAIELGYLQIPEGVLIDIDDITRYPNERLTIITTGSQGEPLSALSRMASGDHGKVSVTADDYIIISATPIPGNEKHVTRVVNDLMRLGAKVIYEKMYDVHVSGHACQDELKMILSITKPRYFLPVHGEYKHRKRHAELAMEMGIEPSRIHLGDIGQVVEIDNIDMRVTGTAQAGMVFVDGLGVGDVGSIVLRDRKILSQDGLIIVVMTIENESGCIVAGPDIVSRGFVYVRESEQLMDEAHTVVEKALEECSRRNTREWGTIKSVVKDALSSFMILPIIMEI